jgi:hypothetical protein
MTGDKAGEGPNPRAPATPVIPVPIRKKTGLGLVEMGSFVLFLFFSVKSEMPGSPAGKFSGIVTAITYAHASAFQLDPY